MTADVLCPHQGLNKRLKNNVSMYKMIIYYMVIDTEVSPYIKYQFQEIYYDTITNAKQGYNLGHLDPMHMPFGWMGFKRSQAG